MNYVIGLRKERGSEAFIVEDRSSTWTGGERPLPTFGLRCVLILTSLPFVVLGYMLLRLVFHHQKALTLLTQRWQVTLSLIGHA